MPLMGHGQKDQDWKEKMQNTSQSTSLNIKRDRRYQKAQVPNALHPNEEVYTDLIRAFDLFNGALFVHQLSEPLFTLQNKPRMVFAFRELRFINECGDQVHEIQLNPQICAKLSDYDVLAIIAHAMCLQWRYDFGPANANGQKPSHGYHDKVIAATMIKRGLIPSDTGEPGGKKTGYNLSHYVADGGKFDLAARELLISGFTFRWRATLKTAPDAYDNADDTEPAAKSRIKCNCEICDLNAWAKPDAQLTCSICTVPMPPSQL